VPCRPQLLLQTRCTYPAEEAIPQASPFCLLARPLANPTPPLNWLCLLPHCNRACHRLLGVAGLQKLGLLEVRSLL
jgi:hypothetical protein